MFLSQRRVSCRQTIDLGGRGGDREKLEPDLNHAAAAPQTANRLVVHDRQIFHRRRRSTPTNMHMIRATTFSTGRSSIRVAFDYAANAWGFTYGASGEWYQDWWAGQGRRVAILSRRRRTRWRLSNGFGQGQFVAEGWKRGHPAVDIRPGQALKLLYWLTRGNLGTYRDAIALGEVTGQDTQSTSAVRSFPHQDGVGLNLEQQLATDFVRLCSRQHFARHR